jgi:hypothetical protein
MHRKVIITILSGSEEAIMIITATNAVKASIERANAIVITPLSLSLERVIILSSIISGKGKRREKKKKEIRDKNGTWRRARALLFFTYIL